MEDHGKPMSFYYERYTIYSHLFRMFEKTDQGKKFFKSRALPEIVREYLLKALDGDEPLDMFKLNNLLLTFYHMDKEFGALADLFFEARLPILQLPFKPSYLDLFQVFVFLFKKLVDIKTI